MKGMKRINALLAICGLLLATGCAGRELTTTEKTAIGGTLLGAGTGALIGSATGKAGAGTAIGAGVGALSGILVGQAIEAEAAKQRRLAEQGRYRQQPLGTYGSTTGPTMGGSPLSREARLQQELERQRQLELQIAREKQRKLEEELARLRAERLGTSVPLSSGSTELSARVAREFPTIAEKEERLKDIEREIKDRKEELDLAKRIDNLDLQQELEQQIRKLEEERAELERQLVLTR